MTMKKGIATRLTAVLLLACTGVAGPALAEGAKRGLVGKRIKLPPVELTLRKPFATEPIRLEAGKYYQLKLVSDGTDEFVLVGPSFFRNIWINEIAVEDVEIRPFGVESFEFEGEGELSITFVPIRGGVFELRTPRGGESETITFVVE